MSGKAQSHGGDKALQKKPPSLQPSTPDQTPALQSSTETLVPRAMRAPNTLTSPDVLQLQRVVGNKAVTQLPGKASGKQPSPPLLGGLIPDLVAMAKDTLEKYAAQSSKVDIEGMIRKLSPQMLQILRRDKPYIARLKGLLSNRQFAFLVASMVLISKHAPGARNEGLRILQIQLNDKDVAFKMLDTDVVIVPRNKQMTELSEFASLKGKKTFDGRWWAHTRGVGDVACGGVHRAAIVEENLLGGNPDPVVFRAEKGVTGGAPAETAGVGYTSGYSTTTHEYSHLMHRYGLSATDKETIAKAYKAKEAATSKGAALLQDKWVDGPRVMPTAPANLFKTKPTPKQWLAYVQKLTAANRKKYECYAAQSAEEYFAQLTNAYLGTNTGVDVTTGQPRHNTRSWIKSHEPAEILALLDKLYGKQKVNEVDANGALTKGGKHTN